MWIPFDVNSIGILDGLIILWCIGICLEYSFVACVIRFMHEIHNQMIKVTYYFDEHVCPL